MRLLIFFFLALTCSLATDFEDDLELGLRACRDADIDKIRLLPDNDIIIEVYRDTSYIDALNDDLFLLLLRDYFEVRSICRFSTTSKLLYEKAKLLKLPHFFSPSPSVIDVLRFVDEFRENIQNFGSPHLKNLEDAAEYKNELRRLRKVEPYLWYSPLFLIDKGSEKINYLLSRQELDPANDPTPCGLRQFWSSMARDPAVRGVTTVVSFSLIGWLSYTLYHLIHLHQIDVQQYQTTYDQNLQFTSTDEYVNQYYNNTGFPAFIKGCIKLDHLFVEHGTCFNRTGYCQGDSSSFANITALSERIWARIIRFDNISIANIESIFLKFFIPMCADKPIYRRQSIARLKQNSSFLLTNWMIGNDLGSAVCQDLAETGPGLTALELGLYQCDPIAVATAMTPTIPFLWHYISLDTFFIVVTSVLWISLLGESFSVL